MEIETEKYIRKPLIVDAVRITTENFDEVTSWCMGEVQTDEVPGIGTTKKFIKVRVNNPKNPRQTKGFVGDWILYTDRGYKVYTNKAFRHAFDLLQQDDAVTTPPTPIETVATPQIPKFYINPASGELTETSPHKHAVPLAFQELMNIVRNELVGDELQSPVEEVVEEIEVPKEMLEDHVDVEDEVRHQIREAKLESVGPVAEDPSPETGVQPISEVADKRVLSLEEQQTMGQDAVREAIRAGDVVLAQDLAESQQS